MFIFIVFLFQGIFGVWAQTTLDWGDWGQIVLQGYFEQPISFGGSRGVPPKAPAEYYKAVYLLFTRGVFGVCLFGLNDLDLMYQNEK